MPIRSWCCAMEKLSSAAHTKSCSMKIGCTRSWRASRIQHLSKRVSRRSARSSKQSSLQLGEAMRQKRQQLLFSRDDTFEFVNALLKFRIVDEIQEAFGRSNH